MILPFSNKFPWGENTYFAAKIVAPILKETKEDDETERFFIDLDEEELELIEKEIHACSRDNVFEHFKVHSIRTNRYGRWKRGRKIQPFYFHRSSTSFQFCPTMPCVSTQDIEIKHRKSGEKLVFIDGNLYGKIIPNIKNNPGFKKIELLAHNDGFATVKSFFKWFKKDFTGTIIHWTDIKY